MRKKSLFVLLIVFHSFFVSMQNTNSAYVDLVTYVYEDETIFNYIFTFDENEGLNKFSIEKPKDAKLDYVVDENGPIEYGIAGDYYIFRPDETAGKTILLKFRSRIISREIYTTQSFKTYVNFDFPVEILEFKVDFKDNFGEIINIFPDDYTLLPNNKIYWEDNNISKNTLYVVNFKDKSENVIETNKLPIYYYVVIFLLIVIIFISIFLLIQQYKIRKNKVKKIERVVSESTSELMGNESKNLETKKEIQNIDEIHNLNENLSNNMNRENNNRNENEENFKEIMGKHLTENEKDVVLVVKENEGIAQNDILNHSPHLTKSNLSKIITKLNSKKILRRIKVGKVNNIYLGEKLESNTKQVLEEKKDDKVQSQE